MTNKRLGFRLGLTKRAAGFTPPKYNQYGPNTTMPAPKPQPTTKYPFDLSQTMVDYAGDTYRDMSSRPPELFSQVGDKRYPHMGAAKNIVKPQNMSKYIMRTNQGDPKVTGSGWAGGTIGPLNSKKVIMTPKQHKTTPAGKLPPLAMAHEYTHAESPGNVHRWYSGQNLDRIMKRIKHGLEGTKGPPTDNSHVNVLELPAVLNEKAVSLRSRMAANPNRPKVFSQMDAADAAPTGLSAGEYGLLNQYMPQFGAKGSIKDIYKMMSSPKADAWAVARQKRLAEAKNRGLAKVQHAQTPKDTFEADKLDILRQLKERNAPTSR